MFDSVHYHLRNLSLLFSDVRRLQSSGTSTDKFSDWKMSNYMATRQKLKQQATIAIIHDIHINPTDSGSKLDMGYQHV